MPFRVGPGGTPPELDLVETTRWLDSNGFRTCELDLGSRSNYKEAETAAARDLAAELDVVYRGHAPLFAILAMEHDVKPRLNRTVGSLHHSLKVIGALGGGGVAAHPGFLKGLDRKERVALSRRNGEALEAKLREAGYPDVRLGVENMAHGPDFGSLDDILDVCDGSEFMRPLIDWGHYQAHSDGALSGPEGYAEVLRAIESKLGRKALEETTYQYSAIEYKDNRERRHLPYAEGNMRFEDLLEALTGRGLNDAVIVSESPAFEDALLFAQLAADWEGSR